MHVVQIVEVEPAADAARVHQRVGALGDERARARLRIGRVDGDEAPVRGARRRAEEEARALVARIPRLAAAARCDQRAARRARLRRRDDVVAGVAERPRQHQRVPPVRRHHRRRKLAGVFRDGHDEIGGLRRPERVIERLICAAACAVALVPGRRGVVAGVIEAVVVRECARYVLAPPNDVRQVGAGRDVAYPPGEPVGAARFGRVREEPSAAAPRGVRELHRGRERVLVQQHAIGLQRGVAHVDDGAPSRGAARRAPELAVPLERGLRRRRRRLQPPERRLDAVAVRQRVEVAARRRRFGVEPRSRLGRAGVLERPVRIRHPRSPVRVDRVGARRRGIDQRRARLRERRRACEQQHAGDQQAARAAHGVGLKLRFLTRNAKRSATSSMIFSVGRPAP